MWHRFLDIGAAFLKAELLTEIVVGLGADQKARHDFIVHAGLHKTAKSRVAVEVSDEIVEEIRNRTNIVYAVFAGGIIVDPTNTGASAEIEAGP